MTEKLDAAIAAVRGLSSKRQDAVAVAAIGLTGIDEPAEPIDPAHRAAMAEGLAEVERADSTDAEVAAACRRFGA